MNYSDEWRLRLCSNGTYYLHKEGALVILDNGEYVTFDKFNKESAEELISIMNKQSVSINSLMHSKPVLTDEIISNLKNENKELKKERNYFERKKCEYFTRWNEYKLDNISLKNENELLKQQLNYIQTSIDNAIKHSKTSIEQKALKRIIGDYNDYMLGHKELK